MTNKRSDCVSEHPFSDLYPVFLLFGGMVLFLAILFYFHYQKLNNEGMIQRQEIHKKAQRIANANKKALKNQPAPTGSSIYQNSGGYTGGSSLHLVFSSL